MKLTKKLYFFFYLFLFCTNSLKAQLNAADSALFYNIFNFQLYVDTVPYPGNWYQFGQVSSVYNHYLIMDTNFKFKTADLDSISFLSTSPTLTEDTVINNSFNLYPALMTQNNPLVHLPFTFLNKSANSYAYRHIDSNQTDCKYAFYIIPGNGQNQSIDIVRGFGYHNQLCYMRNLCIQYGDVFTFIKPNHDSRAFNWNGYRMNEDYLLYYLISANTRYGINYVVEMVAMLKYLKANYDKVFILGLSEGGYSALMATMYEEPDAALISGGYSIDLDTNTIENDFLRLRFDYLLDSFNRVKVKNKITNSKTNYLFTWGENDPVPTMDPEHDFHYTQNYFGPLPNCSYFYDFFDHTFPPCPNIDTFIQRNLSIPLAHYVITDSSLVDTLFTTVKFCRPGLYSFDLFKNAILLNSYTQITDSLPIALTDTGKYYITNILDSNLVNGKCVDTIYCTKYPVVANSIANHDNKEISIQYTNPVIDRIDIKIHAERINNTSLKIYNVFGLQIFEMPKIEKQFSVPCSSWSAGVYFLELNDAGKRVISHHKLLKR